MQVSKDSLFQSRSRLDSGVFRERCVESTVKLWFASSSLVCLVVILVYHDFTVGQGLRPRHLFAVLRRG
jgi:hypothetical protein